MPEVIIAPTRLLGQGQNKSTSINDIPYLPLGPIVAYVDVKTNDDVELVSNQAVVTPDYLERSKLDNDQRIVPVSRSLVGKKTSQLARTQHDLSVVQAFNDRKSLEATQRDYRVDREEHYNLVSLPFTVPESFMVPTNSGAPLNADNTDNTIANTFAPNQCQTQNPPQCC